jgi:hypothetical protein
LLQLKTRRAVETLMLDNATRPLWDEAERYYHGGLETRRNLFDLESWRSAGGNYGELTSDRAAALGELEEWDELQKATEALIAKQVESYDWERGETIAFALSTLLRGGRSDIAIALGRRYFAEVGAPAKDNLNGMLTIGHEMVKAGQRDEGIALIAAGYEHWKKDSSKTEGLGGQAFMAAVRSCAKGTADGEQAFKEVQDARNTAAPAYRAALECRGDVDGLAAHFIEQLDPKLRSERLSLVADLRRMQAKQPSRTSPVIEAALSRPKLIEALDAVSRSWDAATAMPIAANAKSNAM